MRKGGALVVCCVRTTGSPVIVTPQGNHGNMLWAFQRALRKTTKE